MQFYCLQCLIQQLPFVDFKDNLPEPDNQPRNFDNFLTQFDCFKHKGLHFISINARSIMNKLTELQNIAIQTNVAVITISETWLDILINSSEVAIEGYNLIRSDRDKQE